VSTQENLNVERIGSQLAALPPLEEQVEIVAKLDAALFHTERVIQRINAQLERIREYRQALITAAVTGKLDLSKEAA
jgi:type I restriction enzyme S subunit